MSKPLLLLEAAWAGRVLRPQEFDFLPLDCTVDTVTLHPVSRPPPPQDPLSPGHSQPAVVTELEDIVRVGGCLSAHDGFKEGMR